MANAVYPNYKEALLNATANVKLNGTPSSAAPFVMISTAAFTFSAANTFASSVTNLIHASLQPNGMEITGPTIVGGLFASPPANVVTFATVPAGTAGNVLSIYVNNAGTLSASRLVLFEDTGVGNFPVTPNGGNITITWNAGGIMQL
jgi:hypothetical protein